MFSFLAACTGLNSSFFEDVATFCRYVNDLSPSNMNNNRTRTGKIDITGKDTAKAIRRRSANHPIKQFVLKCNPILKVILAFILITCFVIEPFFYVNAALLARQQEEKANIEQILFAEEVEEVTEITWRSLKTESVFEQINVSSLSNQGISDLVIRNPINQTENNFLIENSIDNNLQQIDILASIASTYIATDPEKAVELSQMIKRDIMADSSNICGPLAISILLGWELEDDGTVEQTLQGLESIRLTGIEPNDMWLGTPETMTEVLEAAFPDSEYYSWHITESIWLLDFDRLEGIGELEVGDFLYLDGGSFTHYLVVTRKDEQDRVYSVTNYINDEGDFVIDEVMLWDPETKTGFFRDLAVGIGPEEAYTGRAGFYLWRRRDSADSVLNDLGWEKYRNWFINTLRNKVEGDWNIEIYDLNSGEMFEWRSGISYHSASTIKVPLSVVVMKTLESKYPDQDLVEIINNKGYEGRTFAQLLEEMLVNSEELATDQLVEFISETSGPINVELRKLGLEQTTFYPRRTSQRDMLTFWKSLYEGKLLDKTGTDIIFSYLGQYTSNDDTLLGSIKELFPEGTVEIYNKRGTITNGTLTLQDTGIIIVDTIQGQKAFYVGIAGTSSSQNRISYEQMEEFVDILISELAKYISKSVILPFDEQEMHFSRPNISKK